MTKRAYPFVEGCVGYDNGGDLIETASGENTWYSFLEDPNNKFVTIEAINARGMKDTNAAEGTSLAIYPPEDPLVPEKPPYLLKKLKAGNNMTVDNSDPNIITLNSVSIAAGSNVSLIDNTETDPTIINARGVADAITTKGETMIIPPADLTAPVENNPNKIKRLIGKNNVSLELSDDSSLININARATKAAPTTQNKALSMVIDPPNDLGVSAPPFYVKALLAGDNITLDNTLDDNVIKISAAGPAAVTTITNDGGSQPPPEVKNPSGKTNPDPPPVTKDGFTFAQLADRIKEFIAFGSIGAIIGRLTGDKNNNAPFQGPNLTYPGNPPTINNTQNNFNQTNNNTATNNYYSSTLQTTKDATVFEKERETILPSSINPTVITYQKQPDSTIDVKIDAGVNSTKDNVSLEEAPQGETFGKVVPFVSNANQGQFTPGTPESEWDNNDVWVAPAGRDLKLLTWVGNNNKTTQTSNKVQLAITYPYQEKGILKTINVPIAEIPPSRNGAPPQIDWVSYDPFTTFVRLYFRYLDLAEGGVFRLNLNDVQIGGPPDNPQPLNILQWTKETNPPIEPPPQETRIPLALPPPPALLQLIWKNEVEEFIPQIKAPIIKGTELIPSSIGTVSLEVIPKNDPQRSFNPLPALTWKETEIMTKDVLPEKRVVMFVGGSPAPQGGKQIAMALTYENEQGLTVTKQVPLQDIPALPSGELPRIEWASYDPLTTLVRLYFRYEEAQEAGMLQYNVNSLQITGPPTNPTIAPLLLEPVPNPEPTLSMEVFEPKPPFPPPLFLEAFQQNKKLNNALQARVARGTLLEPKLITDVAIQSTYNGKEWTDATPLHKWGNKAVEITEIDDKFDSVLYWGEDPNGNPQAAIYRTLFQNGKLVPVNVPLPPITSPEKPLAIENLTRIGTLLTLQAKDTNTNEEAMYSLDTNEYEIANPQKEPNPPTFIPSWTINPELPLNLGKADEAVDPNLLIEIPQQKIPPKRTVQTNKLYPTFTVRLSDFSQPQKTYSLKTPGGTINQRGKDVIQIGNNLGMVIEDKVNDNFSYFFQKYNANNGELVSNFKIPKNLGKARNVQQIGDKIIVSTDKGQLVSENEGLTFAKVNNSKSLGGKVNLFVTPDLLNDINKKK